MQNQRENKKRTNETTKALVILLLIIGIVYHQPWANYVALCILFISLITEKPFRFLALLWFSLGNILGTIVTKILLSVIFYVILTPISFLYHIKNRDPLCLRKSKKSLFVTRNKVFSAEDLLHPY